VSLHSAFVMTMPGEHGTAAVGSYIPPGASSTISKPFPNSPEVPLQTTFPTTLPPGVLPSLAAGAGPGRNDGSTGILSALLSEDSTERGLLSEASLQDIGNALVWPAGDRPIQSVPKETSLANGTPSPAVTRFVTLILELESLE
jgi:hypothetical protein